MKYYWPYLIILLCFTNCSDKDDNQINQIACDTSNSEFKQIFTALSSASTAHEFVSIDLETHEYTFFVSSPKTICSIGYQSTHADPTVPYLIEIVNNATSTVVYSGSHVFSTTATSYVSLTSTVSLQANVSYTIKRIQTNWGTNIANTIGRVINSYDNFGNPVDLLPMTSGGLTISSGSFYDITSVGQAYNRFPYIDIVFEN
jgi:hypothetical protein